MLVKKQNEKVKKVKEIQKFWIIFAAFMLSRECKIKHVVNSRVNYSFAWYVKERDK